jgi:hypothetical protein
MTDQVCEWCLDHSDNMEWEKRLVSRSRIGKKNEISFSKIGNVDSELEFETITMCLCKECRGYDVLVNELLPPAEPSRVYETDDGRTVMEFDEIKMDGMGLGS